MNKQNNHSFDIPTFDTITYRIHRGKLAILMEEEYNCLDISFSKQAIELSQQLKCYAWG